MGLWELSYIWHNNPFLSNIVFYGRHIDDVIIIWDGNEPMVQDFVTHCNDNNMGLSFTTVMNKEKLSFLDLEWYHVGKEIHARNYTKPKAGNSFLHYSRHYPQWLNNIPKSQFCRLKNNCTRGADYDTQSETLKEKFFDKGFSVDIVETAYSHYKYTPSASRPLTQADNNKDEMWFITQFHSRHRQMENIVRRHWSLLKQD